MSLTDEDRKKMIESVKALTGATKMLQHILKKDYDALRAKKKSLEVVAE
jgi:hypothetical protein